MATVLPNTLTKWTSAALVTAAASALAIVGLTLTGIVFVATGDITTVAGSDTVNDDRVATEARLDRPSAVAVNGAGDVFIADANNGRVGRVDAVTGVITTIAGGGDL